MAAAAASLAFLGTGCSPQQTNNVRMTHTTITCEGETNRADLKEGETIEEPKRSLTQVEINTASPAKLHVQEISNKRRKFIFSMPNTVLEHYGPYKTQKFVASLIKVLCPNPNNKMPYLTGFYLLNHKPYEQLPPKVYYGTKKYEFNCGNGSLAKREIQKKPPIIENLKQQEYSANVPIEAWGSNRTIKIRERKVFHYFVSRLIEIVCNNPLPPVIKPNTHDRVPS